MDILTFITPTGDRPLAFALCQNWVKKQTLQPVQWIVVDDGKIPLKPYFPMEYIRREPQPDDPRWTLSLNLKVSLPLIRGNKIMIIEDDEYYAPEYAEQMARKLDQHEIVGIGQTRYYHLISGKYFRHRNLGRASLAQTAFRSSLLPIFKRALYTRRRTPLIDKRFWKKVGEDNCGFIFVDNNNNSLYVGIKGLPGRPGIVGHDSNIKEYQKYHRDKSRTILRRWIPRDYGIYLDIIKGKLTDDNHRAYFLN